MYETDEIVLKYESSNGLLNQIPFRDKAILPEITNSTSKSFVENSWIVSISPKKNVLYESDEIVWKK